MFEIVYTSAARRKFSPEQLRDVLRVARANNMRLDISGILLYDDGSFIQVLEGAERAVRELFARISRDDRHERVVVLRERTVQARSFAQWTMGFVSINQQLLGELPMRHGLSSNGSLQDQTSSAVDLLDEFREGRWRNYIMG